MRGECVLGRHLLCHLAGADIRETPIIFAERRAGKSKISRKVIFEAVLMLWRLWRQRRHSDKVPAILAIRRKAEVADRRRPAE